MSLSRTLITALSVVVLSASVGLAKEKPDMLATGTNAPEFSVKDENGKTVSLSDYKGKVVVLEWTNPDCPFVVRHYKENTMKDLQEKYIGKGVVWLAVNSTHYMDADKNKSWKQEQKISYPILVDSSGEVGRKFHAKTTPHMFVIDPEGKIAYQGAIDNDPRGNKTVAEREHYVEDAIDALLTDKAEFAANTTPYGCSVKYKS